VRVLDLSRLIPGPYASLVLSDLGADVVKVEDPQSGDYLRDVAPGMYAALNRGKRSVAVDVRSPDGASRLRGLCSSADVLLESFRPGVLEQFLPPPWPERLVLCRISGFGQEPGPWRERAGHDIGYLALSGVLRFNGRLPSLQLADLFGGGQQAVAAVLAALFERERTGRGGIVDVSMTHGVTGLLVPHLGANGFDALNGARPCYRVYACADGGFLALGALEPKFWERFCAAVRRPEWVARAFDLTLVPALDELFSQKRRDDWDALLRPADCCAEPVLSVEEMRMHPLFASTFVNGLPRTYPAFVPAAALPTRRAPALGEHTTEVLRDWSTPR
jgi:alpha-methylacyl-CoA racemase